MSDQTFSAVILIPSYNTGRLLSATVTAALEAGPRLPVWVVIDGSTDDGAEQVKALMGEYPGRLTLLVKPENGGKGSAILFALRAVKEAGFTHVLTMDADGQHPVEYVATFARLGAEQPGRLIMGNPVFGPEAPAIRVKGRRYCIFFTDLETPGAGLGDPLFGMRLYPLDGLIRAFAQTPAARGYDFDVEIAVRMVWLGYQPLTLPVPVRYLSVDEGGVSHYRYVRDNVRMAWLHLRLLSEFFAYQWLVVRRHRAHWELAGNNKGGGDDA
jgi:glycosyltransferase involved in cell wall biosynthesis